MTTKHEIYEGRGEDGKRVVKMVANNSYEPEVWDDWDVLNEFIDVLQEVALKTWGHPSQPRED
jgi:hypothetical protein